jgi:hypothetical protein
MNYKGFFRVLFKEILRPVNIAKPENCLVKKVTRSDVENLFTEKGIDKHSFYWQKEWMPFISKVQDGDELWFFSSPKEDWYNFTGREGYVIMRKGEKIKSLITLMN